MTLTLYAEFIFPNNFVQVDSKTISFRAQTVSSVNVSLVDAGGSFAVGDTLQTVDFDTLTSAESLAYDTIVRSNDGYSLSFQSQNIQKMKHETETPVVPYSLTVDGGSVNLASGGNVTAATSNGATPADGDRLPTQFTVGPLTGAEPSGNYQDIITVTVSAH